MWHNVSTGRCVSELKEDQLINLRSAAQLVENAALLRTLVPVTVHRQLAHDDLWAEWGWLLLGELGVQTVVDGFLAQNTIGILKYTLNINTAVTVAPGLRHVSFSFALYSRLWSHIICLTFKSLNNDASVANYCRFTQ